MALRYKATIRGAMLDLITTAVGSGGKLRIYDGTQPATAGAATNLIVELVWSGVLSAGATVSADGGDTLLTCNLPTTANVSKSGTTTATWFRVVTSANAFCFDGTVGVGTGDLQLSTTSLVNGQPVDVTSFVIHEANP